MSQQKTSDAQMQSPDRANPPEQIAELRALLTQAPYEDLDID